jgi:DMSO/TMAO reductase YedYZ heme-binding membrane subunit
MNKRTELLENPLFKNRYRVLAIPAQAQATPVVKNTRTTMANLFIAGILFVVFLIGFSLANPNASQALNDLVSQRWDKVMEGMFGTTVGTGMAEKSPWILARAGGIISYLLLFVSVVLGLFNSMRMLNRFVHPAGMVHLHKIISLLMLVFVTLHVVGLMLDSYLKVSIFESLVPFSTSQYKPLWTGLGTLAMYMAVAIIVSFYLTRRLGFKVWRTIHYFSFLMFVTTFLHGLMAGTDSSSSWMQATYLFTGFVVSFLVGIRIFTRPARLPARKASVV